jgi:uncharacterized protein YjeT (DUF2065 family)
MTANTVQKATLAIAATVLVLVVVGYFAMAPPVAAQTTTNTPTSSSGSQPRLQGAGMMMGGAFRQGPKMGGEGWAPSQVNISVGQKFTITSTTGKYFVSGTPSKNGTASGTLTFTVTGKLATGYTLSISSGSLTVAGTTYTVSSGTAQMGRGAASMVGQGATNPTGTFLLQASAHGSFVGSTGTVSLDLQSGSSEYLVFLAGSISS